MLIRKKITVFILFCLFIGIRVYGVEDESLLLKIGNPKLKNKTMVIFPGNIYSARTGEVISFSEMIAEMKSSRFIYVGETHNSLSIHEIQFKVIEALSGKGKLPCIGMEMFPINFQDVLNKWSLGILTGEKFIREIQWYITWNFNFGYYEQIFNLAKKRKISIYALNIPRSVIKKIRMKGWDSLSEEEQKLLPKPDLLNKEHRALIRKIFETSDIPPQMKGGFLDMAFEGLYRAQSAWDEAMAFYVCKAYRLENKPVVVLVGSGHLLYNLGINRRVFEKNSLPFSTLICVPVSKEKKSVLVSRSLANFVWGIPEEQRPAFPSVGLSLKNFKGLSNIVVSQNPVGGAAKDASFLKGDVILSVDGKVFSDINELRTYLARFRWGESVRFRVLRNGEEKELTLKLSK